MDELSFIEVTVENHVPVKFRWIGATKFCAFSSDLFAKMYAGEHPEASLNGKVLQYGPFTLEFREIRHHGFTDCSLVFERVDE